MKLLKRKIPPKNRGDQYMDGLVSTGNQIPITILIIFFPNQKIFYINFIHILNCLVDKAGWLPAVPSLYFSDFDHLFMNNNLTID